MILAPAKINLSLQLKGKRHDGYHEINTIMAKLDLADKIDFHNSRTTSIICDTEGVPTDESNLIFKAVRIFEASYGRKVKQRISLTKNCPHGAGLGGGSSDAASTLLYLNEAFGTAYDEEELGAMAAQLGSDVNFFLQDNIARCTGRGEVCTPLPELSEWRCPILIVKPDFAVATAGAYKNYAQLQAQEAPHPEPIMLDGIAFVNDLEPAVFKKFPILGIMKNWLGAQKGVRLAMMSGSGSSLFALTESPRYATSIATRVKKQFGQSLYTHSGWVNPQA